VPLSLDPQTLPLLEKGNNLLAFSAGVDSSALCFLLLERGISFDIALVNYQLRPQSQSEEAYALELANEHGFQAHISHAPPFQGNFEKKARDFRYAFFDRLMQQEGYQHLITAHQLNDQLEWLLMRLSKGAGAVELVGLDPISQRKEYQLLRPILHHTKEELETYLKERGEHYFIDESNYDLHYERNWFRQQLATQLIQRHQAGIRRSFTYLREDKQLLQQSYHLCYHHQEFYLIKLELPSIKVRVVDRYLKRLGYLLSRAQRQELKQNKSMVIGGVWVIEVVGNDLFIAPYVKEVVMPKNYKEACRKARIPPKVRGYLYQEGIDPKSVVSRSS